MHTLFPHSSAELRKVGKIQFGVLSPDEIVRSPFLAAAHSPFSIWGRDGLLARKRFTQGC
jgi:hypothetical protein